MRSTVVQAERGWFTSELEPKADSSDRPAEVNLGKILDNMALSFGPVAWSRIL